jgi:hypothetical protein
MRLTSTRLVKPSVTQRLRKSMKRKPGGKGKRRMGRPGQGTQIEFLIKVSDDVFESRGASAPNIQPGWLFLVKPSDFENPRSTLLGN